MTSLLGGQHLALWRNAKAANRPANGLTVRLRRWKERGSVGSPPRAAPAQQWDRESSDETTGPPLIHLRNPERHMRHSKLKTSGARRVELPGA